MADPKYAMADGSYPINTCADVSDAAKLAHNSKTYSFEEVRAHVMKAKAALECPDSVLPDTWDAPDAAGRSEFVSPFENGGLFVRSMMPGPGFADSSGDRGPMLYGKLAVFDEWAEIKSRQEGHFLERISRGAFTKTLRDNRKVPVLFQHGEDPQIGGKPLGKIANLTETDHGVDYEVELFDTDYVRSILPALKAGEFGSSFTFNPIKDKATVVSFPQRSSYNPERIPEVTHHEIRMREFGPGIMPYYAGATAGVRSATDEFVWGRFTRDPDWMRERLTPAVADPILPAETALSNERAEGEPHSGAESRKVQLVPVRKRFQTTQGWLAWCESVLK